MFSIKFGEAWSDLETPITCITVVIKCIIYMCTSPTIIREEVIVYIL